MKRTLVASLTAVAIALITSAAQGHKSAAPNKCGLKGARVELLTKWVRVISRGEPKRWYACRTVDHADSPHALRHGFRKRRYLGEESCTPRQGCGTSQVVINDDRRNYNPKVAFGSSNCSFFTSHDVCEVTVRVVALRTGRRAEANFRVDPPGFPPHLDLTADATAVWMGSLNDVETVSGLTLRGDSLRFDEGPDLSDMALVGTRLYWMRGDEPQTAEVP